MDTTTHTCGGTILHGGAGLDAHSYCDRCGAFVYDSATDPTMPTGTDKAANEAAYNDGDERSPEAAAQR